MLKPFCSLKNFRTAALGLVSLSMLGMFAACGDDSSSPAAAPSNPVLSSSSTAVPPVGDNPNLPPASDLDDNGNPTGPFVGENPVPGSSSGVDTPVNPPIVQGAYPDELLYTIDPSIAVVADEDGFYDIADIYKAVPQTSKIAFVIRHSARADSTGQLSPLTTKGAAQAKALGERIGGTEPFYYASTNFVRTRETAANIAVGRGDTPVVETLDIIDGNYFYRKDATIDIEDLKKKSTDLNTLISRYCYNVTFPNAETNALVYASFYPLYSRANQFIKEVVLDNMANWKRVSILVTHDVLAEPMVVYASNRAINLKAYSKADGYRWVNFMSGAAIVVNEAGAVSIYPVRGYDVGWQNANDAKKEAQADTAAEPVIK